MATVTEPTTVTNYVKSIVETDPKAALEIALAEAERERAITARQQTELRERAEVELDAKGNFRPKNLAGLWRLGQMYSRSTLVPDHYKNKPDDCAIGVQMALRCGVDVLTFLQSSYIVHGKPGIEAKLAIAMINSSGQIKGRIRWKFEGEGKTRKCTATAIDALSGQTLEQTVTWAMAEAEGWTKKNGSKWLTIPDLMFQYRSAMWLARTNFPDVLMGMHTVDELEDMGTVTSSFVTPAPVKSLDDLTNRLEGTTTEQLPAPEAEVPTQLEQPTTEQDAVDAANGGVVENPLAGVQDRLNACTVLSDVNAIDNEIREKYSLDSGDDFRLQEMTDAAKARIKEARKGK